MGILCVTRLGPLWGWGELLQKKGAVHIMLSPPSLRVPQLSPTGKSQAEADPPSR